MPVAISLTMSPYQQEYEYEKKCTQLNPDTCEPAKQVYVLYRDISTL